MTNETKTIRLTKEQLDDLKHGDYSDVEVIVKDILEQAEKLPTEKELIDQIVIAESDEEYDESATILGEIAKAYGFGVELTGDGNWILTKVDNKIDVMFDSGRGGEIPIGFYKGTKTLKMEYESPDAVRKLVQLCIDFMKETNVQDQHVPDKTLRRT